MQNKLFISTSLQIRTTEVIIVVKEIWSKEIR